MNHLSKSPCGYELVKLYFRNETALTNVQFLRLIFLEQQTNRSKRIQIMLLLYMYVLDGLLVE